MSNQSGPGRAEHVPASRPDDVPEPGVALAKRVLRRRCLDARAAQTGAVRRGFDKARSARVWQLLDELAAMGPGPSAGAAAARQASRRDAVTDVPNRVATRPTVAIYLSIPPEPGTLDLASELHRRGWPVIVPSPGDGERPWAEPAWVSYEEPLQPGPRAMVSRGTLADLGAADVIIMPGLAGSPDGGRLGYGGAWYDRALRAARSGAPRWLLLNDDEVVDVVPREPHDQLVDVIVTPGRVLRCGGRLGA